MANDYWMVRHDNPWQEFCHASKELAYLEDEILWTAQVDPELRKIFMDAIPHLTLPDRDDVWQWMRERADWTFEQFVVARSQRVMPRVQLEVGPSRVIPLEKVEETLHSWRQLSGRHKLIQLGKWLTRRASNMFSGAERTSLSEMVGKIECYLGEIEYVAGIRHAEPAKDLIKIALERARAGFLPTPWSYFNEKIGGIPIGALSVVAGRPSIGKTCALVDWAWHLGREGIPVLFVSVEMAKEAIVQRLLARGSGVEFETIRKGEYTADQIDAEAVEWASLQLKEMPIYILSAEHGIQWLYSLISLARYEIHERNIRAVLVDYIQLIRAKKEERLSINRVVEELKRLAVEENVAILAAAQLGRSSYTRYPRLSDLFGSAGIEQSADLIWAMWYEKEIENKEKSRRENVMWSVLKNRFGGWVGWLAMKIDRGTASFTGRDENDIPF